MNIRVLTILFLVFISCKNVTEKENKQQKVVVDLTELEKKYSDLKTYFGEENIQIDYYGDSFNNIRITHIPTGKIKLGEKHNTQIENAVQALEKLKLELVSKSKLEIKSDSVIVEFLENPINLQEFKTTKGQSLSSVTNGLEYHFRPKIKDSIYYHYTTFPNDSLWTEISPIDIVVFKYGKNKHSWNDKTEILIEFTVSGNDNDLKKANLVGLTKNELESQFGTEYKVFDNRIVYSNKNKALIIELKNSRVEWFKYIKLSTENIDSTLIEKAIKNVVQQRTELKNKQF